MNEAEIADALIRAPFGAQKPILCADEARIRAKWLVEDMHAIGFEVRIKEFPVEFPAGPKISVPYYEIPNSDFGKEEHCDGKPVHDTNTAHGSGLNWADLVRLSRVCKIGRTLLPGMWPLRFKKKLLGEHNSCVQELLWLARFKRPKNIELEPRPFVGCRKGPDWRFKSDAQPINLEVKYRPGDWIRHVDGEPASPVRPNIFYDVADKFPTKNVGELNIVALTVIGSIGTSLVQATDKLLNDTPTVDAVFIWSESPGDGPDTAMRPIDSNFVRSFFNEGDKEERCYIGVIRHQRCKSEARRVSRTPNNRS